VDPSRLARQVPNAGDPVIRIPGVRSRDGRLRRGASSGQSAREWRWHRCTPSTAHARPREEPWRDPLGIWSDNQGSW